MKKKTILGLCGSLRTGSLNRALLERARHWLPEGYELRVFDIGSLPHYSADLDGEDAPEAVGEIKRAVAESAAVLIATPEYNYGIPGVLKNALDWASRPAYRSVFAQKPVAIMGVSRSSVGTARAQGQLKQVLLGMVSLVYPTPELTVGGENATVHDDGRVGSERIDERLGRLVTGLVDLAESVGG